MKELEELQEVLLKLSSRAEDDVEFNEKLNDLGIFRMSLDDILIKLQEGKIMKFQKGDIIIGKPESDKQYEITTSQAIMKVVKIYGSGHFDIKVKILNHSELKRKEGIEYNVKSKYFKYKDNTIRRLN